MLRPTLARVRFMQINGTYRTNLLQCFVWTKVWFDTLCCDTASPHNQSICYDMHRDLVRVPESMENSNTTFSLNAPADLSCTHLWLFISTSFIFPMWCARMSLLHIHKNQSMCCVSTAPEILVFIYHLSFTCLLLLYRSTWYHAAYCSSPNRIKMIRASYKTGDFCLDFWFNKMRRCFPCIFWVTSHCYIAGCWRCMNGYIEIDCNMWRYNQLHGSFTIALHWTIDDYGTSSCLAVRVHTSIYSTYSILIFIN